MEYLACLLDALLRQAMCCNLSINYQLQDIGFANSYFFSELPYLISALSERINLARKNAKVRENEPSEGRILNLYGSISGDGVHPEKSHVPRFLVWTAVILRQTFRGRARIL